MKKILIAGIAITFLIACGSKGSKEGTKDDTQTSTTDITQDPVYQKGLGLLAKSDCLTCHKIEDVVTGPSYRSVANKYSGFPDSIVTHLANKIIQGGSGVWGQVAMTPHPAISQEDAEAMVSYILLLKK